MFPAGMTDGDRGKRIEIVAPFVSGMSSDPFVHAQIAHRARALAAAIVDALGPVVPLERAQELERERDEARAASRDFAKLLRTAAYTGQIIATQAERGLARHPSFLPPRERRG